MTADMALTGQRKGSGVTGELLHWYEFWRSVLFGLRDGVEETAERKSVHGSRLLIHWQGEQAERLTIFKSGKKAYEKLLPADVIHAKHGYWQREWETQKASLHTETMETVRSPAIAKEPHIWKSLKRAKNATEVRRACSRSRLLLMFKYRQEFRDKSGNLRGVKYSYSSIVRTALYERAARFCEEKTSPRYPRADWNDDKRIEYLARVLAGLSLAKPRRASYVEKLLREPAERNT
jgi:hypothetical protein